MDCLALKRVHVVSSSILFDTRVESTFYLMVAHLGRDPQGVAVAIACWLPMRRYYQPRTGAP